MGPGAYLEMSMPAILSSRCKVFVDHGFGVVDSIDVDVRQAGTSTWVNVHSAAVSNSAWSEIAFAQQSIDGIRMRFNYNVSGWYFWCYGIQLFEDAPQIDPPSVLTETASSVEGTSAILSGLCQADGGETCDTSFEWGLTASYGNTTPWQLASASKGVTTGQRFTSAITGLASGVPYHYRAIVRNSNATVTGVDRVFISNPPASAWISPTGYEDSTGEWEMPANAFDGDEVNTVARLLHDTNEPLWGESLTLTRTPEVCDRIRFRAKDDQNIDKVKIEYRSSAAGAWALVYEGPFADNQWVEKSLPSGADYIQSLRLTFHIASANFGQFWELDEVQLHSVTNRFTNIAGDFFWGNAGNWSLGHVPVAGEAVVFDTSTQATCQALPNSIAQNLHSITVASAYTGRIIVSPEAFEGFSQVLTVANDVTINGGEMVLASKIVNTISSAGVTINASNFTLGAGAVVHADEGGFAAQDGQSPADAFSFGGSHGGRGEDNVSGITYGDPAAPVTSGSGGSRSTSASYDPGGQRGGGAIKINVGTGIVRVDGQLRANSGDDGFHNSAAGGGIFLLCGTFEGGTSGLIQTRGGNISNAGRSPGGGGRIAVNFSGASTFAGAYDVSGGSDPQTHGQTGTLWLPAGSDLTVKTSYKIGLAPGSHSLGNVVIESGAELFCHGSFIDDSTYTGCQVNANSITVEAGGVISADEGGFAPAGVNIAFGPGGSTSGASHGGRGAGGLVAYGDPLNPVTLGSGGNKASWPGSNTKSPRWGGGALKLTVAGALVLDGTISSNGGYHGGGNKGGSGGSVHVVCDTLSGSGSILANGGGGSTGNAGGGRVALEYNSSSYTGSASAAGSGSGEVGSVIPGSLSLAAHATGQTSDSFSAAGNISAAQLLRFSLSPAGNIDDVAFENVEVAKLVFDLSHVSGIVSGDIANIAIYADTNGDGLTTDETGPIATTGAVASIAGDSGTLTVDFAASVLVLDGTAATTNYIIIADVSNLIVGDALKISLPSAGGNVQASGVDSSKTIAESSNGYAQLSGNISSAIHQIASGDITQYQIASGITQTQGNGWSATVTARDVSSNLVDALVEVTLTSSGSAVFYTDSTYSVATTTATLEHGTATIFVKDDIAETIVLTATDAATNTGNSASIVVNPTAVHHYDVTTGTTQVAGVSWSATVSARDAGGLLVSTTNSVTLASTTSNVAYFADAGLTTPITQVALLAGQATVYVNDNVAEVVRLQATDAAAKSGESADVTVAAAAIVSYAVTGTSPRIKGQGFSEAVTALDAFGNTVTTATNAVTLTNNGAALFYTDNNYTTATTSYTLVAGATSIYLKDDSLETIILTADDGTATGDSPSITISLSIQQRIDLATAGDTLIIAPGEYHESFVVNKPLTITTANPSFPDKPIIDGDGATYVCEIAASDVIIEGLEFRDSSSDLVHCQGTYLAGGQADPSTHYRVTIRHCEMHDGGGDGVLFRYVFDGTVENNLIWDVEANGILMDSVGNAVVKHNEIKGAGELAKGMYIYGSYPATVENNYIHDLYLTDSALYFTGNYDGDHSIRNNVIVNNKLRDMVSWHPFGGSALAIRKPTQDGTTSSVNVEHNTIVGNSGQGPGGVTGYGVAWDWNGATNLTVDITNNLIHNNSGKSFTTRIDSNNYGNSPNGIYDYNDGTDGIYQPYADYAVGSNNIGAPPVFTSDPDAYGKYNFALDVCAAQGAASDGRDMGALLSDPNGPQENNYNVEIILGASANDADDLVDVGAYLDSSIKISASNPWGVHPASVRVYLSPAASGAGAVEIWNVAAAAQITYVDVTLDGSGAGTGSFKVKGVTASSSDSDVSVQASSSFDGQGIHATEDLTVLTPASYTLVTTTFRVEDSEGQLITQSVSIEVDGLGTVANTGTLEIRDGTAITYRVLIDYGPSFGGAKVAGNNYSGTVTSTTNVFVGTTDQVTLRAQDQNGVNVVGSYVQVTDQQGRKSGYLPSGMKVLLPVPGTYTALGKIGNVESDGTGIVAVPLSGSGPFEIVAPFRALTVVAKDQNTVAYADANVTVSRGSVLDKGPSGLAVTLPVGSTVEVASERFGFAGPNAELVVGASDTELIASLRSFTITVKDVTTQNEVVTSAWKLLVKGFEKTFGTAGTAGDPLVLPIGSTPVLEGFLWNSSERSTPVVDAALTNVDILIDLSNFEPVKITSQDWSFFSNGFFEGTRDHSADSVTLEVVGGTTAPATLLGNTHWFGYLPLNSATDVTVRATVTNKYGQSDSIDLPNISWVQTSIGAASDEIIPINSQLLLTTDAAGVTGADSIDIVPGDGQATVNIALGAFATVTYSTAGEFVVEARILDAAQQVLETRTINVASVDVTSSSKAFACGLDNTRPIFWDVVPATLRSSVFINAEDPTLLNITNQRDNPDAVGFPNQILVDVRPYRTSGPVGSAEDGGSAPFTDLDDDQKEQLLIESKDGYYVRVGSSTGWIPNGIFVDVDEFELRDATTRRIIVQITDGSWVGGMKVKMTPYIPDITINLANLSGSTNNYNPPEFNSDEMAPGGRMDVEILSDVAVQSFCTNISAYQTNSPKTLIYVVGPGNNPWCLLYCCPGCPACDAKRPAAKGKRYSGNPKGGLSACVDCNAGQGGGLAPDLDLTLCQPATSVAPNDNPWQGTVPGELGPGMRFSVSYAVPAGTYVCVTDESGEGTTYESDGPGSWKSMPGDPVGTLNKVGNEYHEQGQDKTITKIFDAESGRLTSVKDLNGNETKYSYDESGIIQQIVDSYGKTLSVLRTADGYVVVSPGGRQVTVNADGVTGGPGGDFTIERDADGRFSKINDEVLEYDSQGRLSKITRPYDAKFPNESREVEITYGTNTMTTAGCCADDAQVTYTFDPTIDNAWTKREQDWAAVDDKLRVTYRTYDVNGYRETETDADGVVTSMTYDLEGRQLTRTVGTSTWTTSYTALGKVGSQTDANGNATIFTHDAEGNVLSVQTADGATTSNTYNSTGLVTRVDMPLGASMDYTYDANGYRASMTVTGIASEPGGGSHTKYMSYDADGMMLSMTDMLDTNKHLWQLVYDNRGNMVSKTGPLTLSGTSISGETATETSSYNSDDNLVERIDAMGAKWTYTYDERERICEAFKPHPENSNETVLDYRIKARDVRGNVVEREVLARENELEYIFRSEYNVAGRVLKTYLPGDPTMDGDPSAPQHYSNYVTTFDYGTSYLGRDTTVTDARGNGTHSALDDQFRTTTVTYADATTSSFTYDAQGNRLSQTDRVGAARSSTYDVMNRVDVATASDNGTVDSDYDLESRIIKTTTKIDGAQNLITEAVYSQLGRMLESKVNGIVRSKGLDFDGNGNAIKTAFAAYNEALPTGTPVYTEADMSYDSRNLMIQRETNSSGFNIIETWEYDVAGRQTEYTDGRNKIWTTSYSQASLVTSRSNGNGEGTSASFDLLYRPTVTTNARGFSTTTTYNANGWVEKVTRPNNDYSSIEHDYVGNVVAQEIFDGANASYSRSEMLYDTVNRVTRSTALLKDGGGNYLTTGVATSFGYDGVGRRTSVTRDPDGLALTTGFAYDGEGRLLASTRADGKSSTATFNFVGNRITATDEASRVTSYEYDNEARLDSVSAPAQAKVEYVYDQASNLLKLRVNEDTNRETDYEYDVLNRRTLERFPQGQGGRTEREYAYDASHNISQYTDGREVVVDLSSRDGVGRILSKAYTVPAGNPQIRDVPNVAYSYDANGNLTGISNADGSANWSYDALDRLNTESVASGPQITYGYDPRGVVLDETVANYAKLNTTHTYDAIGRRLTTEQDNQTTSFEWDDALRRTKVRLPNAVETKYTFDSISRPTNIEYKKSDTGPVFENYGYTFDDVGNPTAIVTNNGTYAYGYDVAYRLETESRMGFRAYSASHTYDSMGNRLTRTLDGVERIYEYNDADQVTGWTEGTTKAGTYTYDIDGRTTQKLVTDNAVATDQWDYEFDSQGRMVVGQQSVGGAKSILNVYAGDRWYRVSFSDGTNTMKYGWRRDELFAEFNGNGQLTAGYVNDGIDRPFYKTRFSSNGTVVDVRDFYHEDVNLRIHHVTGAGGSIAEKYVYNAYGQRTILDSSNTVMSGSSIGNRIGFQGREHENMVGEGQDAGLTFHRNRFYDPEVGRWGRRDPIGYAGGMNQYRMENSSPIRFIDPLGLYIELFKKPQKGKIKNYRFYVPGKDKWKKKSFSTIDLETKLSAGIVVSFSVEVTAGVQVFGNGGKATQKVEGMGAAGVTRTITDTVSYDTLVNTYLEERRWVQEWRQLVKVCGAENRRRGELGDKVETILQRKYRMDSMEWVRAGKTKRAKLNLPRFGRAGLMRFFKIPGGLSSRNGEQCCGYMATWITIGARNDKKRVDFNEFVVVRPGDGFDDKLNEGVFTNVADANDFVAGEARDAARDLRR